MISNNHIHLDRQKRRSFGYDDDRLVKVEMLLFSIADKDIALEVLKNYGEKIHEQGNTV